MIRYLWCVIAHRSWWVEYQYEDAITFADFERGDAHHDKKVIGTSDCMLECCKCGTFHRKKEN